MVYILLGTGFEEMEAITPCDILRRGGVDARFVGVNGRVVTGGHGIAVGCDLTVDEMQLADAEMIVVPGGLGGVASVEACEAATDALKRMWRDGKFVCAICAAPTLLAKLGITAGKTVTCYPGCEAEMGDCVITGKKAVRDGNLICGQAAGTAAEFGFLLLEALKGTETAENVRKGMVFTNAGI
ncbi:MAG: DJ-1/PfpI family protein [Oscillospiraceae bacterium]|nr:DJ-1/PfpI family protein [Oscillospiraceae bacterium]